MSGAVAIRGKIVRVAVEKSSAKGPPEGAKASGVVSMNESVARPDVLIGATYKIKTPVSEHALYVTINDMVLNEGTAHEQRRPFEIFINSKNLEHFQWIVALTRILSAVFRKGGDVVFLVEELKAVFDPRGGYWLPGGKGFMPSLVAELGCVIERHLRSIGLMAKPALSEAQESLIAEARAKVALPKEGSHAKSEGSPFRFPKNARLCGKCHTVAVIQMEGCQTCLNCADSKCG